MPILLVLSRVCPMDTWQIHFIARPKIPIHGQLHKFSHSFSATQVPSQKTHRVFGLPLETHPSFVWDRSLRKGKYTKNIYILPSLRTNRAFTNGTLVILQSETATFTTQVQRKLSTSRELNFLDSGPHGNLYTVVIFRWLARHSQKVSKSKGPW